MGIPDKPLSSTICCENNSDFEKNILRVLPGLHTFLGCDVHFTELAKESGWIWEEYCNALGPLREALQIKNLLADRKSSQLQIWQCRGEKSPESSEIPPTKNELHQHIKRVNYQLLLVLLLLLLLLLSSILLLLIMFVIRHDLGENQFLYYSSGIVYPYLSDLIFDR